jgi:hypothetical protein
MGTQATKQLDSPEGLHSKGVMPMFAVFTYHAGKWHLVETFNNLVDAKAEADYLRNMLGLNAQAFKRN